MKTSNFFDFISIQIVFPGFATKITIKLYIKNTHTLKEGLIINFSVPKYVSVG